MFVKSLIGSHAGCVFDLRHDAAEIGLANGTCVRATTAEIMTAGFAIPGSAAVLPEAFPDGYAGRYVKEARVWEVVGPDGVVVSGDETFPNLAAARSFARAYAAADLETEPVADLDMVAIPEDWATLPYQDQRAIAAQIKPGTRSAADIAATIQAELQRRAEAAA